jgi:hypothetical protein
MPLGFEHGTCLQSGLLIVRRGAERKTLEDTRSRSAAQVMVVDLEKGDRAARRCDKGHVVDG